MKLIKILLPALITNKKQKKMTDDCRSSLISKENNIEIFEDNEKYETRVAGVWNNFLDKWRGKEYDYLMIVANDTVADKNAIDYMVRFAEDNPNSGMVTGKVIKDIKEFRKLDGKSEYINKQTVGLIDPACFILRKGVIEKVGRIDEQFPVEFVERDYIYRIKLAGMDVIQPDIILWYHPPFAGTIGNDDARLRFYLRRYISKWGGDANYEKFSFPYNDMNLDYTYCEK